MKFPQYVSTSQRTVSVVGMVDKNNTEEKEKGVFIDQKGYIDEDQNIWIFSGEGKPKNANAYPYFWFNKEGKKEFSEPSELIRKAFSTENMKDMSVVSIVENTEANVPLFDEQEIVDINSASAVYIPIINENDDFLKKIVKTVIIQKGVDINKLKSKTEEKYILPNMKAALQNTTKMSVNYFTLWMDLLGCTFEFIIQNDGDNTQDQLKNPVIYQSDRACIGEIVNGNIVDINTAKYMKKDEDDE